LLKRKKELEKEVEKQDFWNNKERAIEINQELSEIEEIVDWFNKTKKDMEDIKELISLIEESSELEEKIDNLSKNIKKKELEAYFNGRHDKGNAILSIFSGAGGQDAEDWAAMLLRMYNRYCERKNFKIIVIDESFGEEGDERKGIKSVMIEIKGKYAYGLLKNETGVHRLVRISPFSAQKLRHTSFALIEVLPEITNDKEVEIKEEDIRIDYYRASGPGGQYVNKRDSAVRITHIPTGTTVSCQSERLQGKNKEKAMSVLMSKLYNLEEEKQKQEISKIKGDKVSASWGNQIRSYVLHPYKLVKDLRTNVESTQPEKVLDGELDEFIEEEIKL
jgi:peptide chain release factor 2